MKFLVYSLLTLTASFGISGISGIMNRRFKPPPPDRAIDALFSAVSTHTIQQPLDHFSEDGNETTWHMIYMTNDQFFEENGPILMLLGGEWKIDDNLLLGGQMFEIGRSLRGHLIYTQHRYYGDSRPTNDTSSQNLKYLSVDQALADVAKLIRELKATSKFANSPVVVFGGSYAGNMATWSRMEYPDFIDGAVASSGPVLAKADFFEYIETVADALAVGGSQKCVDVIKEGFENIQAMLKSPEGVKNVSDLTCTPLNTSNHLDVKELYDTIINKFCGVVQSSTLESIQAACAPIIDDTLGMPEKRIAIFFRKDSDNACTQTSYDESMTLNKNTSYADDNTEIRLWTYQTCTEFGFYATTNSTKHPFGNTVPLSRFVDNLCKDIFGEEFGAESVANGVSYINSKYGGLTPNVTKVVSIHGSLDPWHRLGITKDLSEESPAFLINGTSHVQDMSSGKPTDPDGLVEVRKKLAALVAKWVREAKEWD